MAVGASLFTHVEPTRTARAHEEDGNNQRKAAIFVRQRVPAGGGVRRLTQRLCALRRARSTALAVGIVASGGLHLLFARLTPKLAPLHVSSSSHAASQALDFELAWTETKLQARPTESAAADDAREPAPAPRASATSTRARAATRRPDVSAPVPASAAPEQLVTPASREALAPLVAPRTETAPVAPLPLDLRPSQVARAFLGESAPAPASGPPTDAPRAGATSASVAASLRPAAAPPRPEPVLVRREDGSYHFKGNGFHASIARDGSVRIDDKYGSALLPFVPVQLADGSWTMSLGGVAFDLMALLDHAFGNDPYRSERVWFFNGTRALRERLAEQAAEHATRARLLRIWSEPAASLGERKRRTFSVWEECTEDARGQTGRAVVERFVRESCPQQGPRGFTDEDLRTLNASRKSRAPFAPYGKRSPP